MPLSFNYDNDYGEQLVVRAAQLLDYTPGGPDKDPAAKAGDIGAGDEIHGESGDDFVYGMTGNDVLFGEGQDDDLIGGWGHDWISGGTGQDGVLGDDGRIFTSRNTGLKAEGAQYRDEYAEELYGIYSLLNDDPDTRSAQGNVLNETISTPGDIQHALINREGDLNKTVDLTPFNVMENLDPGGDAKYADDVIFGGLGSDWLHGGSGDDAISGAEALPQYYARPINPGDILRFSSETGEFAEYEEYNPLTEIFYDADNPAGLPAGIADRDPFILNFDHTEGPDDIWSLGTGIARNVKPS